MFLRVIKIIVQTLNKNGKGETKNPAKGCSLKAGLLGQLNVLERLIKRYIYPVTEGEHDRICGVVAVLPLGFMIITAPSIR